MQTTALKMAPFRKFGCLIFGVLIIRILLFRVSPIFGNPQLVPFRSKPKKNCVQVMVLERQMRVEGL